MATAAPQRNVILSSEAPTRNRNHPYPRHFQRKNGHGNPENVDDYGSQGNPQSSFGQSGKKASYYNIRRQSRFSASRASGSVMSRSTEDQSRRPPPFRRSSIENNSSAIQASLPRYPDAHYQDPSHHYYGNQAFHSSVMGSRVHKGSSDSFQHLSSVRRTPLSPHPSSLNDPHRNCDSVFFNKRQLDDSSFVSTVWGNGHVAAAVPAGYTDHPEIATLSDEEVRQVYRNLEVTIERSGKAVPKPIQCFDHAPFPDWILHELHRLYSYPTPIQCVGWPVALSDRDMIGIAQTGSGKTLAYLLPGIVHMQKQAPLELKDGPLALVMAPTRELAMQIEKEAFRFTSLGPCRLRVACVYGGVHRGPQAAALHNGVHICIATPGRLLDFLGTRTTNLRRVTYLVLDEADRMLDMGFEPQIRIIVSHIRPDRQTLMWSATWPKEVQRLARDFCRYDPVRITVGSHDLQANSCIAQRVEICRGDERFARLVHHLANHTNRQADKINNKVLVFCETKKGCDALRDRLRSNRAFRVAAIHGDKEQRERDRILSEFKLGRINTLIATDVASRGLDIKDVDLVINYDVPKTIEDYIHRIGRTGRAGEQGTAITLFDDSLNATEKFRMAKEIASVISGVGQVPPTELTALARMASFSPVAPPYRFKDGPQFSRNEFKGGRGGFRTAAYNFQMTDGMRGRPPSHHHPWHSQKNRNTNMYETPQYRTGLHYNHEGQEPHSSSLDQLNHSGEAGTRDAHCFNESNRVQRTPPSHHHHYNRIPDRGVPSSQYPQD